MLKKIREQMDAILASGDMPNRRPELRANNESNIPGCTSSATWPAPR